MKFSGQILAVKNMKEMISFYCDFLNFEVITAVPNKDNPEFTILQNENVQIMLETLESLSKNNPNMNNYFKLTEKFGVGSINYIKTTDIEDLYKTVKENSVPILKELHETWYGAKEFIIEDPEGYLIMFSQ
ncbi:VOC family protein [Cytobacillus kochii]|uniref:VOC family protein n=1 Tax=Cytobacillus kochii TaxID=859143 RepID=UPI001CD1B55B|nr:VOC family protein [Cytobacillus kochii]MCA1028650.1 VOC family protein [Cytobacillus kochii]